MTFKDYLIELRKYSGYDFCDYSDNSINRRLQKVLSDYNISIEELVVKTREDSVFVEKLIDEITVNTTELFRDSDLWIYLYEELLPQMKNKKTINIWHAGCSSGQEVYSNIILLTELGLIERCNIYATDLNQRMIDQAKSGCYKFHFNQKYFLNFDKVLNSNRDNKTISPDKYFDIDKKNDLIQVKKAFLEVPHFKKHDLVNDKLAFYHKFDIVFCRNVLIYFNNNLQNKIVKKFYDQMFSGGGLILGSHESLNGFFKTKFTRGSYVYFKNNSFQFKY